MKKDIFIVGTYSAIHFIVDMMCGIIMMALVSPLVSGTSSYVLSFLLYNLFAFAFQLPFGIFADKLNKNAYVSAIGCLFIAVSFALFKLPLLVAILAGVGNALFHVGGGIDVLNIADRKASKPGIYVATGAIGLFLGQKFSSFFINYTLVLILILLASAAFLACAYKKISEGYNVQNSEYKMEKIENKAGIVLTTLFITIVLRSCIGFAIKYDWKSNLVLSILFVFGVVFGKMFGGILGDKFGLKRVATVSLIASAFCLGFASNIPALGIIGILLFNMTMPITLIMASNILPNNKGLAFGLTTLALFVGAVPSIIGLWTSNTFNVLATMIGIFASAIIFYIGALIYDRMEEKK